MRRSPKTYDLAVLFAALSDRTRLRLLNLMDGREVCVCYFVEILEQSQPKISRHLAYLRRAGIVAARREGQMGPLPVGDAWGRWSGADFERDACGTAEREGDAGGPGALQEGVLRTAEGDGASGCAPADGGGRSELLCGLMQWVAEKWPGA